MKAYGRVDFVNPDKLPLKSPYVTRTFDGWGIMAERHTMMLEDTTLSEALRVFVAYHYAFKLEYRSDSSSMMAIIEFGCKTVINKM